MKKQFLLILLGLLLVACGGLEQKHSETQKQSFQLGGAPMLTVDNFAGDVIVRAGEDDTIRVVAIKRAAREKDLDRIDIEFEEQDGALEIATEPPSGWKNVSVDLEIIVPLNTRLDLYTGASDVIVRGVRRDVWASSGAGDVDVRDTSGAIAARTKAGSIDVRDAMGVARLNTNAGSINYQGRPQGKCRFETLAGSIKIRIPPDVNLQVDLETVVGDVDIEFPIEGSVSRREVIGTIGNGAEGEIRAYTNAGSIELLRD